MVRQVRAQLKKIAITDKARIDEMFLRYNNDRTGAINTNNLRDLCKRLQLPIDEDVLQAVSSSLNTDIKLVLIYIFKLNFVIVGLFLDTVQ